MDHHILGVELGQHDELKAADDPWFGKLQGLLNLQNLLTIKVHIVKVLDINQLRRTSLSFEELLYRLEEACRPNELDLNQIHHALKLIARLLHAELDAGFVIEVKIVDSL